jgi:magnesium-transporting ATPase (P-type)
MKLTFIAIPNSFATLAIIIALFAVFFGIMALVLWVSVNLVLDRYPEMPLGEGKHAEDKVLQRRRRLLNTTIILDGLILTIILFTIIYIANTLIQLS